jgi:hypothetical protein
MTDADRTADACPHDWCLAHRPCDCPYSSAQPHMRAGCRYRTINDDQDDQDDES